MQARNTKGRPKLEPPAAIFAEQLQLFNAREITAQQAAANLGISRMTFFRRLKESKAKNPM